MTIHTAFISVPLVIKQCVIGMKVNEIIAFYSLMNEKLV